VGGVEAGDKMAPAAGQVSLALGGLHEGKGLKVMRPRMHPITDKSGSQMFNAHFRTVIFALKDHTQSVQRFHIGCRFYRCSLQYT
jgi:hypothetical protein